MSKVLSTNVYVVTHKWLVDNNSDKIKDIFANWKIAKIITIHELMLLKYEYLLLCFYVSTLDVFGFWLRRIWACQLVFGKFSKSAFCVDQQQMKQPWK